MSSVLDSSLALALEGTYGTGVTVTRAIEYTDADLDYNPMDKEGGGTRPGYYGDPADRVVTPASDAGGSFDFEPLSKGQGVLWQALMGAGSSTLVSGSTYQGLFTFADALPSFTLQEGVPRLNTDGSATIDAITYTGCVAPSWEISASNADILKVKAKVDAQAVTTATPYQALSLPTNANLFHFAGAALYMGAVTVPTTTVLGSAPTAIANVDSWSLSVDHSIDKQFYHGAIGKQRKPVAGRRQVSGKLAIEYTDTAFRDALLNRTHLTLVATYTAGSLSTGLETLQFVVPDILLKGQLPKGVNAVRKMDCSFKAYRAAASQLLYVVTRTSDTAL